MRKPLALVIAVLITLALHVPASAQPVPVDNAEEARCITPCVNSWLECTHPPDHNPEKCSDEFERCRERTCGGRSADLEESAGGRGTGIICFVPVPLPGPGVTYVGTHGVREWRKHGEHAVKVWQIGVRRGQVFKIAPEHWQRLITDGCGGDVRGAVEASLLSIAPDADTAAQLAEIFLREPPPVETTAQGFIGDLAIGGAKQVSKRFGDVDRLRSVFGWMLDEAIAAGGLSLSQAERDAYVEAAALAANRALGLLGWRELEQ